ncbi:hypothetical protein ES705_11743 [subsurface metagenome]
MKKTKRENKKFNPDISQNLSALLNHTVNEPILIKKMEKYFTPRPASLAKSEEEEKKINRKLSKISEKYGGPPQLLFIPENQSTPPMYDTFIVRAIDEIITMFKKCRYSICKAHLYFVSKGFLEKYPNSFINSSPEEINTVILKILSERFFDEAEISYIRLASYWDRVGQLLDFIYFNIRQYERDVFPTVLDRIKINYLPIYPKIAKKKSWVRLREYQISEKTEGMKWLLSRRNLLIHSLHLSSNYKNVNEDHIYISSYNHLKESIHNKLKPQNEQEEINLLHVHLRKAACLFYDVIELCNIKAETQNL